MSYVELLVSNCWKAERDLQENGKLHRPMHTCTHAQAQAHTHTLSHTHTHTHTHKHTHTHTHSHTHTQQKHHIGGILGWSWSAKALSRILNIHCKHFYLTSDQPARSPHIEVQPMTAECSTRMEGHCHISSLTNI